MKRKKGMTLIELLAVIAIIAILFVLLIPNISRAIDKARIAGIQTDMHSYEIGIRSAIMGNNKEFDESMINEVLDNNLKFDNNKSKKNNPYGEPYELEILSPNVLKIVSKNAEKRYAVKIQKIDGEIESTYLGFNGKDEDQEDEFIVAECKNQNANNQNDFEYEIDSDGVVITAYKGTRTDVEIPCEIEGKPVYKIQNMESSGIVSVIIPTSVKIIGTYAFFGNELVEMDIPNSVETIESGAFSYISTLKKVTIPPSIKRIEYGIFKNDSNLEEVELPNSIEYIGEYAFYGVKLNSIVLPKNLKEIGKYGFAETKIKNVVFNEKLEKIGESAFYSTKLAEVILPDSLMQIGQNAFNNSEIQKLVIGDGIEEIGDYAFYYNNNITDLNLGNTVKVIGRYAFREGFKGTSLELPKSVIEIKEAGFSSNKNLTSIKLNEGIKKIGNSAFRSNSLVELTIPSTVETLGEGSFYDEGTLKKIINKSSLDNAIVAKITGFRPEIVNE